MPRVPADRCSRPSVDRNGDRTGSGAERWRFATLLSAPHRLAFFTAMALLAAVSLWWTTVVVLRALGDAPPPFAVPAGSAHALAMGGSFMPMFFAGFLCTVGPRWLQLPAVNGTSLLPLASAWLVGWPVFVAGAQLDPRIAAAGLAIVAFFWTAFVVRLLRMIAASRAPDRLHLLVIAGACAIGALAFWIGAWGLAAGAPARLALAESVLLHGFLAPVFVAALHRMVPFVHVASQTIERRFGNAPLALPIGAFLLQPIVQAIAGATGDASIARALHTIAFVVDAAAAALLAWIALRWRMQQNLRIRLLAMLFGALAWLGIAFALQAADAFALASGFPATGLRLAALHALAMGFFASTMLAMVSRVTCGQAGRMLSSETIVWWLFLALQAAVVLRLIAAALPAQSAPLVAAALVWTAAMLIWSLRYAGWYGRPRTETRAR
ncbi:MAG: NnrS family protein [Burkholderiaceae bacterium]|nr:NnrS family protein [Burkholderiaceae bacterium]